MQVHGFFFRSFLRFPFPFVGFWFCEKALVVSSSNILCKFHFRPVEVEINYSSLGFYRSSSCLPENRLDTYDKTRESWH